ncbi:MAG TPA: hypothetical protein VMV20_08740 [Chitinophagaceae bacterium]|nr:hypothetical protein [Chitinophagaceae bacterium]
MLRALSVAMVVLLAARNLRAQEVGVQPDTTLESLEALLDTTAPIGSQLVVSAAFGNNPYEQLHKSNYILVNKSFFMPEIAYTHRTGLGISLSAYDLFGSEDNGWFEYDVAPSYTFDRGKDVSFGISYQKYLYSKTSPLPRTPLTNETYAYVLVNSWWVQPGAAVDYAWGTYTLKKKTYPADDFDILLSIQHAFDFSGLFTAEDDLNLTPALNLVLGTEKFTRSFGSTKLIGRAKHIQKNATDVEHVITGANINTYTVQQSEFLPRTFEASIDLSYQLGKFSLEPQYYFDIPLGAGQTGNFSYFLLTAAVTF